MTILISFRTSKFDTSKERPNPINPIFGESVLHWLKQEILTGIYSATDPDAEDWGWYVDVVGPDAKYLVGSIAYIEEDEDPSQEIEWLLQVHKKRSFKEKIMGQNKLDSKDHLVIALANSLRGDASIRDVEVEEAA